MIDPRSACSTVAAALALLLGCNDAKTDPPAKAATEAKVVPRVELEEIPEHSAAAMAEADKPKLVTTTGSLSATLNGHPTTFTTLTIGANAAVWTPETRVARVTLGGSAGEDAFPALRLQIEGVRLDRLELPAKFTIGGAKEAKTSDDPEQPQSPPRPRIVYEIEARKIWEAGADRGGAGTITIESFEGKRVRGTFSGKLEPRSSVFGPPVEITDGKFEIDLRLHGVEPGRPAGTP